MSEPEEPLIIPMGGKGFGRAKWVGVIVALVVIPIAGWLIVERIRDARAAEAAAAKAVRDEAEAERLREERRRQAASGRPLASAHKPPPGWTPPKKRIPSEELFSETATPVDGTLPTPLPGRQFAIDLPATWEHHISGDLLVIRAPQRHFTIIASAGTHANDGNTERAIEKIGAVNCNWRKGDGPKHGQLGSQRIPAFFNEGVCGHTDGYGLIWIVRVYAGDDVTSLVARYSADAGEDAEDVLLGVLRTIAPM